MKNGRECTSRGLRRRLERVLAFCADGAGDEDEEHINEGETEWSCGWRRPTSVGGAGRDHVAWHRRMRTTDDRRLRRTRLWQHYFVVVVVEEYSGTEDVKYRCQSSRLLLDAHPWLSDCLVSLAARSPPCSCATAISITSGRPTPTDARTLLTRIIQEIQKIHASPVYVFVGPKINVVGLPKVPPVCLSNLRAR